ncbi:MAG: hypothetical protein WCJ35_04920 [Planctomycetota bacterium]
MKHQFLGHILISILCCFTPVAKWGVHGSGIVHVDGASVSWHTPLWADPLVLGFDGMALLLSSGTILFRDG